MDPAAKIDTIDDLMSYWDSGEGRPFKGRLIDLDAYSENPSLSCMCAQGQILHVLGGWTPERLVDANQTEADAETARIMGISRAHAVLLREVNDSEDGAPSVVLTDPGKILGPEYRRVLAFWKHLDRMTADDWKKADAAWAAQDARAA